MNTETLVNELTGKNEQKAHEAAKSIVNEANTDAFSMLVDKSVYLYDFIKSNVNRRFESVINRDNYKNLLKFLNYYSPDYEDLIAGFLAKYADEDLSDALLELLEGGSIDQKIYCAKYFSYIPDTAACELLSEYAFSDNESLAYNAAQALGAMDFKLSYNMADEMLKSDDDFIVFKAVKFLVAYGCTDAVPVLLEVMKKSSIAENIAGEIPFLEPIPVMLDKRNEEDVLFCLSKILSGLGEILSLSQIFSFELYDVLAKLIQKNKTDKNSLISVILLKALQKFELFEENEEYTFDEDNATKAEIREIYSLLKNENEDFWNEQKSLSVEELTKDIQRILSAVHLISELKITGASENLHKMLDSDNEIIVTEAVIALSSLGEASGIDKQKVLQKINDDKKKEIIENTLV